MAKVFKENVWIRKNTSYTIVAMSNDFKTKILIEKSKQEKKANLFIKYFISLGLVLLLGIFFFTIPNIF